MGFRGPAFSDQALDNHTLSDASVMVSDPITKGSISDVQFTFIYRQGSVKSEELSHLCSGCLACRHGWMSTDRERPRPKIAPHRQVARP